jgi:hypothetical protein
MAYSTRCSALPEPTAVRIAGSLKKSFGVIGGWWCGGQGLLLIARSPTLPTTSSQVAATISFRQTRGRRRRAPRCTTATSGRRLLLVGSGSPPRHHCSALVCSRHSASLPRVSSRARPRHARRLHTTGTVSSVLLLNSLLVSVFLHAV